MIDVDSSTIHVCSLLRLLCTHLFLDFQCAHTGNGHAMTVQWLLANSIMGCTYRAMDWAAAFGDLELLKTLKRAGAVCTSAALDSAAGAGQRV